MPSTSIMSSAMTLAAPVQSTDETKQILRLNDLCVAFPRSEISDARGKIMRRIIALSFTFWLTLCLAASAQQGGPFTAFPPGTFDNKAARDPPAGGGTTVTFDAKCAADAYGASGTSISSTCLTIGTGQSNYALVVQLIFAYPNGSPPTSPAVTWNGTSMTLLQSAASPNGVGHATTATLWGLLAPASGNHTIAATWTGTATDAFLFGESYYNVSAFQNATNATGSSTAPSLAITTAANDVVVDSMGYLTSFGSNNLTLLFEDDVNGAAGSSGGQYGLSSSGTTTASWTVVSSVWAQVGVDLKHQ
jgi:hypothetical protein